MFLMRVGLFFQAYGRAAFVVARLTGYKIRRVHRTWGDIHLLGFNALQLDAVRATMAEHGITLTKEDEEGNLWHFEGGDDSVDESMVQASAPKSPRFSPPVADPPQVADHDDRALAAEVLGFNLASATPMEAMLFLNELQKRYGTKRQ